MNSKNKNNGMPAMIRQAAFTNMKRILALLLCMCLALGLTACSGVSTALDVAEAVVEALDETDTSEDSLEVVTQTSEAANETSAAQTETAAADAQNAENGQKNSSQSASVQTTAAQTEAAAQLSELEQAENSVVKDGTYTSKYEVAAYIHLYGKLPSNYITKKDAEAAGWESSKGNLWDVTDHKSIGGSRFGNYEGLLPDKDGRKYYECDIDYEGGRRNAKRIIYSNDGLVFYTEDHYETFEQLY